MSCTVHPGSVTRGRTRSTGGAPATSLPLASFTVSWYNSISSVISETRNGLILARTVWTATPPPGQREWGEGGARLVPKLSYFVRTSVAALFGASTPAAAVYASYHFCQTPRTQMCAFENSVWTAN
jgi:hypothetical protein